MTDSGVRVPAPLLDCGKRRGAHDDLAHLNAASEEDLVKAAVQQLVVVLDSAVRTEDKLGRETVRDEHFDDGGGVRRELGRA